MSSTPLLPSNTKVLADVAGWSEHIIAETFDNTYCAYPADIDSDGDIDILGASQYYDVIAWWENDGNQNFTKHVIDNYYDGAHGVYAIDIDGDSDTDVLGVAHHGDEITWWENDGDENFTKHLIDGSFEGARCVYVTDIDDDGDMDVLGAANQDGISLWENNGDENFTSHIIDADLDGAFCVYAADVDGDSDTDILGAGYSGGGFAWYENVGSHNFIKHTIDSSYNQAAWVFAIDLDGDNDTDVLGATGYSGDEITWWENDGSQNFIKHVVSVDYNGSHSVYATDLDSDDDIDILGTGSSYGEVTWWENDDNQGFTEHNIDSDFGGAYGVYAADMDLDGDIDVLGAAVDDNEITWWENLTVAPLGTAMSQIQTEVNQLRGLSTSGGVARQFMNSDELRQKLIEETVEGIEEINITKEILVLLDLMEEGQDLYEILLDLHSNSTLGFYDSNTEEIYIISDVQQLGPVEKITYAHEFTHALQDQHFDLGSLGLDSEDNSDLYRAVLSLVEGDATLLMGAYYWEYLTDTEREEYDQAVAGSGDGALNAAPRVIRESFIFPYVVGLNFVSTIWQSGGWDAVNDVYSNLPQSTEQIIHPEKYLSHDKPQSVTLPDLEGALGGTWSQLDTDVLGELYMRLYLEAFIDTAQATAAAEGWDGDRYVYLKDADDNKLLVISSMWDSISDANEFFDAYIDFMEEKSDSTWALFMQDTGKRWWQNGNSSIYLSQNGEDVLLIIAPDDATAEQVLTDFPGFYTPEQEQEEEPEQEQEGEENGEVGGCSCGSNGSGVSANELFLGWVIIGMCWGGGYYFVRRRSKHRNK